MSNEGGMALARCVAECNEQKIRAEKAEAKLADARKYPEDVQRPDTPQLCSMESQLEQWREYTARLEKLWVAQNLKLGKAEAIVAEYTDIVENSHGVTGWHLNDDVAEWDEFEEAYALRHGDVEDPPAPPPEGGTL